MTPHRTLAARIPGLVRTNLIPAVLASAALIVTASGCGTAPSTSAAAIEYVVDREEMLVSLPIDVAVMTWNEQTTLAYADGHVTRDCLEKSGFTSDRPVYDRRAEVNEKIFLEIGPWTAEMASTWGYEYPPDTKEKEALLAEPFAPGEEEALIACAEDTETGRFEQAEFELDELKHRVLDSTPEWDESLIETIRQDLNDCLSESGYSLPAANADRDLWTPIQVNGATAEEERQIALVDVDCKDQHDIVDRWAKVSADWENEAIAVHTAEIASYRKKYDPVIAEARQLIESAA